MSWYSVEVQTEPGQRDAVAAWLVAHTGQAIEERPDGTLISFAPDLPAAESLGREVRATHGADIATRWHELPDVDWTTAWREGLGVRQVGPVAVVPSWLSHIPSTGQVAVVIDPETAFGSGEHGSTRAALALLARLLRPGDRMLDLGSGSGILAISAAKLGASRATGIEADGDALPVGVANAARNQVEDRVDFLEGDAAQLTPLLAPVDLIVSNILRLVNIGLLPEVHDALRPGGIAIFSGMEPAEADLFRGPLTEAGFRIEQEEIDSGWWAVAARRA